ncbi:DUF6894 family protein [Methylobacterium longum]|uniref:DUF6894 domain-containing protein n=1 Tax=Methylobacterium longum TaxID=767694 RepID=A0ABT8AR95_9HYPH|nr:hypothetical protein [Methylobacterium longum]MDN3572376.1 hypothetical protein [Methylobacterium longum]GJE09481.1 hypothetical protein FOHLNKBM_0505 [Methylobacterium longum]
MPLFFFDLRSRCGLEPDDIGLEFASAEIAYMEACSAILDLTAELLRAGGTSHGYAFEVSDEAGRMLWRIPFSEILGRMDNP